MNGVGFIGKFVDPDGGDLHNRLGDNEDEVGGGEGLLFANVAVAAAAAACIC